MRYTLARSAVAVVCVEQPTDPAHAPCFRQCACEPRRHARVLTSPACSSSPNRRGASRRWIVEGVEGSLRRLGTEWIDLYQALGRVRNPPPAVTSAIIGPRTIEQLEGVRNDGAGRRRPAPI